MWAWSLTWKLPWLALVEVDLGDGIDAEGPAADLAPEVVSDELLIGGVEAEARREGGGRRGTDHRKEVSEKVSDFRRVSRRSRKERH